MIESLHIKGFQKHKDLLIEFDPHCTTIIGVNEAGKTAILRTLKWVCFNTPSGSDYINWYSTSCVGKLRVDGHTVIRKKGKRVNYYKLDGKKFLSPKTSVPVEIAKLLNVSDLNFQEQHDAIFLLSESPGQISRKLNAVIDLEEIDKLLASASSSLRYLKDTEHLIEERLKEAKEKKEELAWVKEFVADLQEIEELKDKHKKESQENEDLALLIKEYEKYQAVLSVELPDLDEVLALYKKEDKLDKDIRSLEEDIAQWEEYQEEVEGCDMNIAYMEKTIKSLAKERRCPTCGQKIPKSQS